MITRRPSVAIGAGSLTAGVPRTSRMLLRHLSGQLYAVLAVWDLTELERAVLAGRA